MEMMGEGFHERVWRSFAEFSGAGWQREHPECGEVVAIDAAQSQDQVFASILAALGSRWPRVFSG
jgi:hypothetical protein